MVELLDILTSLYIKGLPMNFTIQKIRIGKLFYTEKCNWWITQYEKVK